MIIYARVRETVLRRLAEVNPRPSQQAVEKQLAKLEEAIAELEKDRPE